MALVEFASPSEAEQTVEALTGRGSEQSGGPPTPSPRAVPSDTHHPLKVDLLEVDHHQGGGGGEGIKNLVPPEMAVLGSPGVVMPYIRREIQFPFERCA